MRLTSRPHQARRPALERGVLATVSAPSTKAKDHFRARFLLIRPRVSVRAWSVRCLRIWIALSFVLVTAERSRAEEVALSAGLGLSVAADGKNRGYGLGVLIAGEHALVRKGGFLAQAHGGALWTATRSASPRPALPRRRWGSPGRTRTGGPLRPHRPRLRRCLERTHTRAPAAPRRRARCPPRKPPSGETLPSTPRNRAGSCPPSPPRKRPAPGTRRPHPPASRKRPARASWPTPLRCALAIHSRALTPA
jgi:hypothetical protein